MVLSPIGTFMVRMDAALAGSVDALISAMTTNMAGPIVMAAVVYYGVQGLKLANGDPEPLQGFWMQLIRVGVVIWLSTNLPAFNQWVRAIFFVGLPNALVAAIGSSTGTTATTVNATAAIFDGIWNQVWVVVGTSWVQAGLSVTGIIAGLSGFLTALICGLGLCIMALVYVSARMVLAVLVCMAPVIIGCAMFQVTRPIFERAVGKAISLMLLQAMGLIILQILLLGDQWLMAQVTTQILVSIGGANALFSDALQGMAALCVWFLAGAFAMWNLPAIAYSIGGGIAGNAGTSLLTMALMRGIGGGSGGGASRDASFGGGGGAASLSLAVAPREVSGGGNGSSALPPPPPPSISQSTRS